MSETKNIEMKVTEVTEVTEVTVDPSAAPAAAAPAPPVEIKLNEVAVTVSLEFLVNVRNILDVCTTRSVWKSNELSTIGRLYDGINDVIKNKVAEIKPATGLATVPE